jgi:hypothetical protein
MLFKFSSLKKVCCICKAYASATLDISCNPCERVELGSWVSRSTVHRTFVNEAANAASSRNTNSKYSHHSAI